jgi:Fe-S-cluster-containing dehydrogenase component/formate-dependent nitrite reductase membrane component NrfD
MPTFGFLIDNRKCIGCHACTVACKSEHEVPLGVDRTWVKYIEKGSFPNSRRFFSVMRCNHCDWAPCVTICPVTALYRRGDGVIDFNSERCIGCKACLQACPYDALYIDPDSGTAAKCNFCTHRLEVGLEPACVVVCPEQAIVAGDLDNPQSQIVQLIAQHPVQVRKPEKGTRPKLFYIEADEASLVPSRTATGDQFMWTRGEPANRPAEASQGAGRGAPNGVGHSARLGLPVVAAGNNARRVYDVRPRKPAWGWEVAGYTWTKSIAAGASLAMAAARLAGADASPSIAVAMGVVGLIFLALTAGLLVVDLKQPRRFLYVLLRPQWGSWLVRGAYILTGYGAVLTLWLLAHLIGARGLADLLLWPGAILAAFSAVYTGFLFAQAKGRDFWQNPLLSVHLLAQAMLAGGCVWLMAAIALDTNSASMARAFTLCSLGFSLIAIIGELLTTPPTTDARTACAWIVGGPMGGWFWAAGVGAGHIAPILLLLVNGASGLALLAAVLALAGLFIVEWLWLMAPQHIPLS